MKLVSWNVWNHNQHIDKFQDFLREQNAHVFAFQELTQSHIEVLRSLEGYHLHVADDFIEGETLTHLGILTQLSVLEHGVTTLNLDRRVSPSWIGKHNRWIECLQSHHLTISVEGIKTTILNLHLSCGVSPTRRRWELMRAIGALEKVDRIIVCGDMNTFANPTINWLIGWFYGFTVGDIFTHEINSLDRFARSQGMIRTPTNIVTFPRWKLHLDHILVRGIEVFACDVVSESYGSDHVPVSVSFM